MSKGDYLGVEPVLDGTVALVTGASSGIGAATAAALAAQGAAVALAARRADRLEAVAAGITGQGGTALILECDITDEHQATHAVERTVAELGRLDTVINNAGVMRPVTGGQPTANSRCVIPSAPAQCGALPPILAWGRAYLQNELSTTPKPPESSHGPSSPRTIATTLC
jgi:NAD(P)-dependent dehydrogenase (short-subunit alcohol dehydrogenase family)